MTDDDRLKAALAELREDDRDFEEANAELRRGIAHLQFLWEQNVRALADDPVNDSEGWPEDAIAAGRVLGRDFWEFVKTDPEISDFERDRLAALFPTEGTQK